LLVSFGINDDWSFEHAFLQQNPSARVIGVDGSVSPSIFAKRAASELSAVASAVSRFKLGEALDRAALAGRNLRLSRDFAGFFRGRGRTFVNKFVLSEAESASTSSTSWRRLSSDCDMEMACSSAPLGLFLKMDIEGAEYAVLPDAIDDLSMANGIAIEFHECGANWTQFTALLRRLRTDFVVAHIHGNNWRGLIEGTRTPDMLEISLINRRMLRETIKPSMARYPRGGLDTPNRADRPDFALDF
jgi:hypothetical protein